MAKKKFKDTKLGGFLSKVAPKVTDVLGNLLPDRGILGIVKNIIDKDPDVNLSPEDMAEYKRLEQEEFKSVLKDTQDARDMQKVALQQDDLFAKRYVYYLASFWSVVGAAYIFFATFTEVVNPRISDTVLGFLMGTIVSTIISYFYGSSRGSKGKSEDIGKILNSLKRD